MPAMVRIKVRKVLRFRIEVKDSTKVKTPVISGQKGMEGFQAFRPAHIHSTLSR